MGIEQLVDTFKGNPQPLQAKVQKAQQSQPPGFIAPDMEEALALQEILELQKGAQNQQAIQAGGPSPTIMEKLRQMVGTARAQGQPQMGQQPMPAGMPQQPVMAARGGSIDQLMSNLGRHYASGGIIAFNGEDDSDVKEPKSKPKLRQYTLQEQGADYQARKQAAREAAAKAEIENEKRRQELLSQIPTGGQEAPAASGGAPDTELTRNINNTMAAMPGASVAKGFSGGIRGLMALIGGLGNRESNPAAPKAAPKAPTPYMDSEVEKLRRLAANPPAAQNTNPALQPGQPEIEIPPIAVKPTTNVPGNRPDANTTKPVAEAMDPMEAALRAAIMKTLGKNEDQEFEKGSKRYQDFMGLDRLLAPREARIAEREGMQRKIQGERLPAWVEGFSRASKPIVSGGIGTILDNLGSGMQDKRQAYSAEDVKFFDQISDMKDEVLKLRLEGKYKAAAAGENAIKDMLADKRQAESSGTSLLNTKENARSREQTANIAAQTRRDVAAQAAEAKRAATKNQTDLQLERLKQAERAQQIKIAQAGITAQRPAIDAAAKEAKMHRMIYEALKDRDPDKAAASLARAEDAQHRIDMILAPLGNIAGSSPAAVATGKPAPLTGGAKFLGFEPSKS
jgi:hypothetical protein